MKKLALLLLLTSTSALADEWTPGFAETIYDHPTDKIKDYATKNVTRYVINYLVPEAWKPSFKYVTIGAETANVARTKRIVLTFKF